MAHALTPPINQFSAGRGRRQPGGIETTAPLRGRTLDHLTLSVNNAKDSVAFYQRVLGLPLSDKFEDGYDLARQNMTLSIIERRYATIGVVDHFSIGVEGFQIESTVEALRRAVVDLHPTVDNDTHSVYLRDPDNIRVQLQLAKIAAPKKRR